MEHCSSPKISGNYNGYYFILVIATLALINSIPVYQKVTTTSASEETEHICCACKRRGPYR